MQLHYGIFPGSFNPPTSAHLALATAALDHVDQVFFILPRAMPHKEYSGVPFQDRFKLLSEAIRYQPRFRLATCSGGLYIEIAHELKRTLGAHSTLHFLCGSDAAERIVTWDYQGAYAIGDILDELRLLVAPRNGALNIPDEHRQQISSLALDSAYQTVSATDFRQRIRNGEPWEHLIPRQIREKVQELYGSKVNTR